MSGSSSFFVEEAGMGESRSGKTNSKANQNSRLASKNFIKKR